MRTELLKHYRALLAFMLICSFSINMMAQSPRILKGKTAESFYKDFDQAHLQEDSTLSFISFKRDVPLKDILKLTHVFKLDQGSAFDIESTRKTLDGLEVIRLKQTYQGIPILGADYIIRAKNGMAISANGKFYDLGKNQLNPKALISEEAALAIALKSVGAKSYMWESDNNESFIKKEKNDNEATFFPQGSLLFSSKEYKKSNDLHLVYQFNVYASNPVGRYIVEVDAKNGELVNKYNTLHHTEVDGTGNSVYNGVVALKLNNDNGNYQLSDVSRGQGIYTYDMLNGQDYGSAVLVSEPDNFINEEINRAGVSAHWGAAATYDYFFNNFGLNSFDGNAAPINSYVRFDYNYVNAFWDGSRMTYGDGDQSATTALVSLDIVGHEIAHAVTQYSAALIYMNESGALNESFSDIFGQSIEFEAAPETASWNLGDEIFTNGVDMIRSISDPNSQGQPDTYLGDMWYTGSGDNGGVHYNSGVQNFWFYLLVEGGSDANDLGYNYNVPSIGREKAEQIAFRNLQIYLSSSSTYTDARVGSEMAAIDLYGEGSAEHLAVIEAWNAVGVPSLDPEINVPSFMDFGLVLVDSLKEINLLVRNNGLAMLTVDSITIDNNNFSVNTNSFVVPAESSYSLPISLRSAALGEQAGILTLFSSDEDVQIQLSGEVIGAPQYSVSIDTISSELLVGNQESVAVSVTNSNHYDLDFNLSTLFNADAAVAYMQTNEMQKVGKAELPLYRETNTLLANQEEVSGGYVWQDSNQGVAFTWFDISSIGTPITLYDDYNSSFIPLNMYFPFFDESFSEVSIGSNGWISFTNNSGRIWSNPLPNTTSYVPENVIAIMARDLYAGQGSCHYYYDATNKRFIVQYTDWTDCCNSDRKYTMQIQLYENGKIKLLYDDIRVPAYGTVGIQNATKDNGLTIAYDEPNRIVSGYAVEISKGGQWLSLASETLTVAANSTQSFIANISAIDLASGSYQANITLSNAGLALQDTILVQLNVFGGANLVADTLVALEPIFTGDSTSREFLITNLGSDTLEITDMYFTDSIPEFTIGIANTPIVLAAGASVNGSIAFTAPVAGDYTDTLTLTSNDAEGAIFEMIFSAQALDPPVMQVLPDTITAALFTNDSVSRVLTIDNSLGSSNLYVNLETGNYLYSMDSASQVDKSILNTVNQNEGAGSWLSLSKLQDTIPAGEVREITVSLNAKALFGGVYSADIIVSSNDPVTPQISVPVFMDVTGAPEIFMGIDSLDFSRLIVEDTSTLLFNIENTGTDVLELALMVDNPEFSIAQTQLSLMPRTSENVLVTFNPVTVGEKEAILSILSNDSANDSIAIALSGRALEIPSISYSDSDVEITAFAGEEVEVDLSVINNSTYEFALDLEPQVTSQTLQPVYHQSGGELKLGKVSTPKYQIVQQAGMVLLEDDITGGYAYKDTDDGLPYNWFDIRSLGTSVSLSDDSNSSFIPLGMEFPFFEESFSDISIGSNGWVSFTNNSGSIWSNPLPGAGAPENVIAILANDLHPGQGSCQYYYDDTYRRFIVQYTDWTYYGSSGMYFTMQIQLYESGKIQLLYDDIREQAEGTVGIQNASRDNGLTVAYFEPARIVSGYAVEISKSVNWLSTSVQSVQLPASGSGSFKIEADTRELNAGTYTGKIFVSNPEFNIQFDTINVSLILDGAPNIDVSTDGLAFGENYLNVTDTLPLLIRNVGSDELTASIAFDNSAFSAEVSQLSIPARSSEEVVVFFNPQNIGSYNGKITITSNDPVDSVLEFQLTGAGVYTPSASISASEIISVLQTDQTETKTFQLNNGENSALLTYNVKIELDQNTNFASRKGSENPGFYSKRINQDLEKGKALFKPKFNQISNTWNNTDIVLDTLSNIPEGTTGAYYLNGLLYLVNYLSYELQVYDMSVETVVNSFPIHANPLGIAYDGQYFWIGDYAGVVRAYDLNGNLSGNFDLQNPTYHALTYNGSRFLATPLFNDVNSIAAYNLDGTISAIYELDQPLSIFQILFENNTLWISSFTGDATEIYRSEIEGTAINISDTLVLTGQDASYSLAHTGVDLIVLDWYNGYVIDDGTTGWLDIDVPAGSVSGGAVRDLALTFDAQGLEDGLYEATVKIFTNDPDNPELNLSAKLSIGNYPPELTRQIDNQLLYLSDSSFVELDLNDYFSDRDGQVLSFTVDFDREMMNASISGSSLFLIPLSAGVDTLTLSAFDGSLQVSTQFEVEVSIGNYPPELTRQIDNQLLYLSDSSFVELDLNDYFFDRDGQALSFTVGFDREMMNASISGSNLSLIPLSAGVDTLTLSAFDGSLYASMQFEVEVSDEVLSVKELKNKLLMYPNPALHGLFNIDIDEEVDIQLFDMKGARVEAIVTKIARGYQVKMSPQSGVYIVKGITSGKAMYIGKIVFQE